MAIRELNNFTAGYKRPRFGNKEAEQDWLDQCKRDKQSQKVPSCVARGCSVETGMETTLREFEPVSAADVGGYSNLDRLRRIGVVSIISEREAKTARNEYDLIIGEVAVTHGGKIFLPNQGVDLAELNVPEDSFRRSPKEPLIVLREARDGSEVAEDLIKDGLARRAKLRDAVIAKAKQALKREDKEAGK